jgi:hypothetical protein
MKIFVHLDGYILQNSNFVYWPSDFSGTFEGKYKLHIATVFISPSVG